MTTLAQRLKLPPKFRTLLRERGLDAGLLLSAALCFGLFIHGQLMIQSLSGIGGPVATLTRGGAERKALGSTAYAPAGPGTEFFNLDVAWVGKEGMAEMRLDDGAMLELGERTLVILKKPFKVRDKASLEDKVKVVKGEVKTKSKEQPKLVAPQENTAPEVPDMKSALPGDKDAKIQLYPPQDGLLFMRNPDTVNLKFAWPVPVTGYLVIRSRKTGAVSYVEVKESRFADAPVEQESIYYWQLVDPAKKVLFGPYRFELRKLDPKAVKEALEKSVKQPTDVYW